MIQLDKNNKATKWLIKKSILNIALEGNSFGAERAQVRTINDNDHIIPLYSYGVGAFEFDHKKVNPMAKMDITIYLLLLRFNWILARNKESNYQ